MKWWVYGLAISLFIGGVLSLFASSKPDGLERVAEDLGFLEKGEGKEVITSPMPDYTLPAISNETLSASLAGIIGVLMMFALTYGIGKLIKGSSV